MEERLRVAGWKRKGGQKLECLVCGNIRNFNVCLRQLVCAPCNKLKRYKEKVKVVFSMSTTITEVELYTNPRLKIVAHTTCIHGATQSRGFHVMKQARTFDCMCDYSRANAKRAETTLERYGVRHVMQVPEIFSKAQRTAFGSKMYKWPSGNETSYQGYENWLYDILLKDVPENGIVTDRAKIKTFNYVTVDGAEVVYYPDAQVGNVIYEVKSWFTYDCDKSIELKSQAVVEAKYTMEVWFFEKKNHYYRRVFLPDGRKYFFHPKP